MAGHANLGALISDTLVEMRRLGYSESTMTGLGRMSAALSRYAVSQGREESGEELAIRFPDARLGVELTQPCQADPGGSHPRAWLRAMRVPLETGGRGRVRRRMPGDLAWAGLPGGSRPPPGPSDDASRRAGHPGSTIYSRNGRIKHFLIFLAGDGGTDASRVTGGPAHDHVPARSSSHAKSVRAVPAAPRCPPRLGAWRDATSRRACRIPSPAMPPSFPPPGRRTRCRG